VTKSIPPRHPALAGLRRAWCRLTFDACGPDKLFPGNHPGDGPFHRALSLVTPARITSRRFRSRTRRPRERIPLPVPSILGPPTSSDDCPHQYLGRDHAQAAPSARRRRPTTWPLYQAGVRRCRCSFAAAARRLAMRRSSPTSSASTSISLTWELDFPFFANHFVEGYRGEAFTRRRRAALAA